MAAYIVILGTKNYTGLIFAMVLATLGEMLLAPAVPVFLSNHGGLGAPFYIGLVGRLAQPDGCWDLISWENYMTSAVYLLCSGWHLT